jgi:anti-anti-sigma factor
VEVLPGSAAVQWEGEHAVLSLTGEVDTFVIDGFERLYGTRSVPVDIIDAGAVTFMSASGISLMLGCLNASTEIGRAVTLRQTSPCVDRLLGLVGLQSTFRRE